MDSAELRRRLGEARVGRLATVGPHGRPHLVPVCSVLEGEVLYWAVDFKPKATRRLRRIENLAANAEAELLVDHYEEDWTALWWIRVRLRGGILPPGPEAERALDLLATKYEQYRAQRPAGPVVRMDVLGWTSWSGGTGGATPAGG